VARKPTIAFADGCHLSCAVDAWPTALLRPTGEETPMPQWSKTWTFIDGDWHEGNPPVLGPRSHAFWLGSSVFDGARAFEGVTPDIDRHCERVNRSALSLNLAPTQSAEVIAGLVRDGLKRFAPDAALYIRPMYWAEAAGGLSGVAPDPASTRFLLSLYEAPMPEPKGLSITLSPFRRPTLETMPVDAKAGCLYPNNARALTEAAQRGFDNAVLCDMLGNVAELATANLFIGKDGTVATPAANGTFLAGITRRRVLDLMRDAGQAVSETILRWQDILDADEVFSVGNYGKVQPITRVDDRPKQPGPLYRRTRSLYWEFAHAG
jgi:branched-chain amino acid aminotransferase